MPGVRCCVAICNNNFYSAKQDNLKISFHVLPKDKKLRKIWVERCKRRDLFNSSTAHICSAHFEDSDFERDLQAELLSLPPRKRLLKKTAVPSKNFKLIEDTKNNVDRLRRAEVRDNKKLVEELLRNSNTDSVSNVVEVEEVSKEDSLEIKYQRLLEKYEKIKAKYDNLNIKNNCLEKQVASLKKNVLSAVQNMEKEKAARVNLEEILNKIFSKAQMEIVTKTKQKVRWSNEDIATAFAIRYLSKRCYIYLRSKMHYPLPHISTLQKWATKLNVEEGTLTDILKIMKVAGMNLTDLEKTTVIQYDEMKVQSLHEYDTVKDQVKGPHNYVQVIMARGLFKNWKQPVYIDFDQKITKEILFNIINELHYIGYEVVACVSDCGKGNIGLWKELDITLNKTYFTHPKTNKNIFVFADPPHLIKLLRNWFLDTGFILADGSVINKEPLEALMRITDEETTVCHKLTNKHIDCHPTERHSVSLATQLLSHTTATALCHCLPGCNKELASKTGEFIELASNWFDILNSYSPKQTLCTKKPYGLNLEMQNIVLDEMENAMKTMLCNGKTTLQTFQQGIIITSKSLKGLFGDLAAKKKVSYILTHRLSQDSLESTFDHIRTMGGLYDHPSPMEVLHHFRLLILGKNPGVIQQNTNSEPQNSVEEEYLVADVMNRAAVERTCIRSKHLNSQKKSCANKRKVSCDRKIKKKIKKICT